MTESLLVAGIVCIVASIVGGGVKLLGAEMPVLNSFARQALLFAVGAAFLFGSFWTSQTKPAPAANTATNAVSTPTASAPLASQAAGSALPVTATAGSAPSPPTSTRSIGCPETEALACLPRSSGPVTFENPASANLAAAANLRDALSTTQAQENAVREGASGKASRLCGIVGSNDSSPLGKHNAAVRLNNLAPGDGQATDACMKFASNFL